MLMRACVVGVLLSGCNVGPEPIGGAAEALVDSSVDGDAKTDGDASDGGADATTLDAADADASDGDAATACSDSRQCASGYVCKAVGASKGCQLATTEADQTTARDEHGNASTTMMNVWSCGAEDDKDVATDTGFVWQVNGGAWQDLNRDNSPVSENAAYWMGYYTPGSVSAKACGTGYSAGIGRRPMSGTGFACCHTITAGAMGACGTAVTVTGAAGQVVAIDDRGCPAGTPGCT